MFRYPPVSVIIPAYNEEKSIGNVINETVSVLDDLNIPYEIIVVNDGSTDKTGIMASSCKVQVLNNNCNCGKGFSLRKALNHANGDIVVTIDSDGEHKPKELIALINSVMNGSDVAAGSRFMGRKSGVTTRINVLGNNMLNLAIFLLTGYRITDSQTGFRAAKKEVLLNLNLNSDRYEIETEITVKCLINNYVLTELPITVERRKYSASKLKILYDGTRMLMTILESCFLPEEKKDSRI